jgi:hypothetical protein
MKTDAARLSLLLSALLAVACNAPNVANTEGASGAQGSLIDDGPLFRVFVQIGRIKSQVFDVPIGCEGDFAPRGYEVTFTNQNGSFTLATDIIGNIDFQAQAGELTIHAADALYIGAPGAPTGNSVYSFTVLPIDEYNYSFYYAMDGCSPFPPSQQ